MQRRVLVITGGHRVDLGAFLGMVEDVCAQRDWAWAHAVQPSAQRWLRPEHAGRFDAILCHDLPGVRLRRGAPPTPVGPHPDTVLALTELLDRGQGLVVLHHALAGWPAWEGWAEALGGRFHYAPGRLRGQHWPSSGTRIAHYTAKVAAPEHPVCAGVTDFALTDELYCCPVFTDDVVPLLRTDADLDRTRFLRAHEHVHHGEHAAPDCSAHPPASDLIGWATTAGRSPVVVLQPGDSAETFAVPAYRRLLGNALAWVGSPPAHRWAIHHPTTIRTDLQEDTHVERTVR
ncbi:ThuA domain-containing protein [Actinophytocola sp.]|uniref:ThuA domain-containing protein n=1 Tax=Actinophytocola sp. TaxID=1872138 RepID=UPI002ED34B3F